APPLAGQHPVPPLALHHEVTGGDAAAMPPAYSADLTTAREQFAAGVARARPSDARLIAEGLEAPARSGPVRAAWIDGGEGVWWAFTERGRDSEAKLRLASPIPGVIAMWSFDLARREASPLPRADDGAFRFHPGRRMTAGIVACTIDRCALADVMGMY